MSSSILDFQCALKAVNGNKQLANDLLATLLKQLDDYKNSIQSSLTRFEKQQLQDTIHKINGAMRYVGAPTLAEKVAELDGEILSMADRQLSDKITEVLAEIDKIIKLGSYPE